MPFAVITGTATFVLQYSFASLLIATAGAHHNMAGLESLSFASLVLTAVVIAPLVETLLAQTGPIHLARLFTTNPLFPILVSTIVFSGLHITNGIWYCVYTLPSAIVYAVAYYFRLIKDGSAYWTIAMLHAVQNCWAILLE